MRQGVVAVKRQGPTKRRNRLVDVAAPVRSLEVTATLQIEIVGLGHLRAVCPQRVELVRLELEVEQACHRFQYSILQQERVAVSGGYGVALDLVTARRLHERQHDTQFLPVAVHTAQHRERHTEFRTDFVDAHLVELTHHARRRNLQAVRPG